MVDLPRELGPLKLLAFFLFLDWAWAEGMRVSWLIKAGLRFNARAEPATTKRRNKWVFMVRPTRFQLGNHSVRKTRLFSNLLAARM